MNSLPTFINLRGVAEKSRFPAEKEKPKKDNLSKKKKLAVPSATLGIKRLGVYEYKFAKVNK